MRDIDPILAAILILLLAIPVLLVAAALIGTVSMPWTVGPPPAEMNPNTIDVPIGAVSYGEIKTQSLGDSLADLIVNKATDIIVTLGGDIAGISPLTVTVELWLGGVMQYSSSVTDITPTATFTLVPVDTYDIYIGYSVTGTTEESGTATITLDYP